MSSLPSLSEDKRTDTLDASLRWNLKRESLTAPDRDIVSQNVEVLEYSKDFSIERL